MINLKNPSYKLTETQSSDLRAYLVKVKHWIPLHKLNHLRVVLSAQEAEITHRQLYLLVSMLATHHVGPLPNWIFDLLISKKELSTRA